MIKSDVPCMNSNFANDRSDVAIKYSNDAAAFACAAVDAAKYVYDITYWAAQSDEYVHGVTAAGYADEHVDAAEYAAHTANVARISAEISYAYSINYSAIYTAYTDTDMDATILTTDIHFDDCSAGVNYDRSISHISNIAIQCYENCGNHDAVASFITYHNTQTHDAAHEAAVAAYAAAVSVADDARAVVDSIHSHNSEDSYKAYVNAAKLAYKTSTIRAASAMRAHNNAVNARIAHDDIFAAYIEIITDDSSDSDEDLTPTI